MINPAEKHIDKLTAIIARRDAKIAKLQDSMTEREREAVDAYVKIERLMDTIAEQTSTTATLRATVADLQADVGLQRLEIADLLNDYAAAKHRRNLAVKELQRINMDRGKR